MTAPTLAQAQVTPTEAAGSSELAETTPVRNPQVVASLRDGFGVRRPEGRFGLSLGLLGHLRYDANLVGESVQQGFSLPLLRPYMDANLWGDRVEMRVMPELADVPELLDATAIIRLHDAFAVQLGQYRPWLSRGYRTGLNLQALGERGLVVDTFRIDRDVGLTLRGRPLQGRFEYYLGVMNGEGKNTTEADTDLLYTARIVVAPLGPVAYDQVPYVRGHQDMRVAIGASAYTVENDERVAARIRTDDANVMQRREVGASADLVVSGWRLAATLEGFWRASFAAKKRRRDAWGAYGQLSALVVRDRLDIAVRAGALSDDAAVRVPIDAGFNIYAVGHTAKLQLRYRCIATANQACAEQGAMAQLQLWI